MHGAIGVVVERAIAGEDSTSDAVEQAFAAIMDGESEAVDTAALLTSLAAKGESVTDVVGVARAMSSRASRIVSSHERLLDTCGTGGDRLHTFNISTATALVAAACGVPVAKHGNRGVSSSSGSADVLRALGVTIDLSPDSVSRCLDEIGIGFCFAPLFHSAMKHAAPVRAQLGIRTIFNLVGPLTNPANASCQLLGANGNETAELLAGALLDLGRPRAIVVCGNDELDEVALWGETLAWEVDGQAGAISRHTWSASDFGVEDCDVTALTVDSPEASAEVIAGVLDGETGPARDIVVANTAAALYAFGQPDTLAEAAATAQSTLDSGLASELLERLVTTSRRLG